jgi:hypothetical protein
MSYCDTCKYNPDLDDNYDITETAEEQIERLEGRSLRKDDVIAYLNGKIKSLENRLKLAGDNNA